MNANDPIIIPFSKSKTFVWLIGAIGFVAIGCRLLFGNPTFNNGLLDNPWVKVSNPQAYTGRQTNILKRKMLALNYKWHGAPVGISANGLKISFEELLQLVSDRFEAFIKAQSKQ